MAQDGIRALHDEPFEAPLHLVLEETLQFLRISGEHALRENRRLIRSIRPNLADDF